jgi:hypothetical protein
VHFCVLFFEIGQGRRNQSRTSTRLFFWDQERNTNLTIRGLADSSTVYQQLFQPGEFIPILFLLIRSHLCGDNHHRSNFILHVVHRLVLMIE